MGKEKSKKRKKSASSKDSPSSSSSESSREKKKIRKMKKKLKKEQKRTEKALKKKLKEEKKRLQKELSRESSSRSRDGDKNEKTTDIPIELMERSKAMAPMTKEEWDKRQSVVRRVLDEESGRYRLIKGDGEVLEEIVSRERHKQINRSATQADGAFFQAHTVTYAFARPCRYAVSLSVGDHASVYATARPSGPAAGKLQATVYNELFKSVIADAHIS